ncbi:N-dimethylarginine dimethylaminohydrolase [Micromonospora aurantiaca]|uniref:dimethylarginine dimethylaminohydrolase family protein n=1 Tax=Micromonospora aurantiaca (nom. illeg.) TaxID=47850 RepID=UPI000F3DD05C|nr:arginine deiminase family protein [Micromonospora aurantiaca]RNH93504.1 N-dimethylarginine dimethylaminohydrolase [Micromonospora aurantiaca]
MVNPNVTSEYDTLRCVAMRYAGDFTRKLDGPGVHPILARQQTTSMWAEYSAAKVRAQQEALITVLRARGTEVILLPQAPGCSAQHYPRDIGFVIDNVLFLARLNSAHRLPEANALAELAAGMPRVEHLTMGSIEGGDVMLHDRCVLVGLSEETSLEGAEALQAALGRHQINREVVPVTFASSGIVHLDDHFNIIAPGTALIHRSAFTPHQARWFEKRFDLIDVTDEEALHVHVNVLALAPGVVVVAAGSSRITGQITARGIDVLTVDYSEVTRIPGSLRCTTLPLRRI